MNELNVALQGGGAHGAFTWGVLDRLLEEPDLRITAVSGSSAGAMNGAMLASGMAEGGADGAKQRLDALWQSLALGTPMDSLPAVFGDAIGTRSYASASRALVGMSKWLSPYDTVPADHNPLRDMISGLIDFDALNEQTEVDLFIAATQARTGKLRLFRRGELTVDTLLASACLPSIHKAVEIEGELYWDGGWAGNPVIFPLIEEASAEDILVVLLQPLQENGRLRRAQEIAQRATELAFTTSFVREMQDIARTRARLKDKVMLFDRWETRYNNARFHIVQDPDLLENLQPQTRLDIRRSFLLRLKQRGRDITEAWLETNRASLGHKSSFAMSSFLT